jgi:hypothetical protein
MNETTLPTVGRIVHFYDQTLRGQTHHPNGTNLNGVGVGPYPAMVIQTFGGNYPKVNLLVHGWGGDWREGSVEMLEGIVAGRYWTWPPRE